MHICHEEILAVANLMQQLPFVRFLIDKIRAAWHRRFGCVHPPNKPK